MSTSSSFDSSCDSSSSRLAVCVPSSAQRGEAGMGRGARRGYGGRGRGAHRWAVPRHEVHRCAVPARAQPRKRRGQLELAAQILRACWLRVARPRCDSQAIVRRPGATRRPRRATRRPWTTSGRRVAPREARGAAKTVRVASRAARARREAQLARRESHANRASRRATRTRAGCESHPGGASRRCDSQAGGASRCGESHRGGTSRGCESRPPLGRDAAPRCDSHPRRAPSGCDSRPVPLPRPPLPTGLNYMTTITLAGAVGVRRPRNHFPTSQQY